MFKIFVFALLAVASAQDDLFEQHVEYPVGLGSSQPRSSRWGTIQYFSTQHPNSVIITDQTTSNYYGCIGVLISNQHVLVSKSCNLNFNENNLGNLGAVAAQAVDWTQENSFRKIKSVNSVGQNLVVFTLQNKIQEEINIYDLPSQDLEQGETYSTFGWAPTCLPVKRARKTFTKNISIIRNGSCRITSPSLACGQGNSMMIGEASPVVSGKVIYGFTDFQCSTKGPVAKVFPFVNSIKAITQNNSV